MLTRISGRGGVSVSEREQRQNRFDGGFDRFGKKDSKSFYTASGGSSDEMILGEGITRTIEIDVKSLEVEKEEGGKRS